MYQSLTPQGVRVPNGIAVTAEAYRATLYQLHVCPSLRENLSYSDLDNVADLARRAAYARDIIYRAALPKEIAGELRVALEELTSEYGQDLTIAVRSSATAEDLPNASFAGQHDIYLNIHGAESVLDFIQHCFARLFTDRAIRYRIDNGFDLLKAFNSLGIMKMVPSDLASPGSIFTINTETGLKDVVFITGAYG